MEITVAFKHFIKNLDVLVQLIETDKAGYRNELEILTRKILLEIRATLDIQAIYNRLDCFYFPGLHGIQRAIEIFGADFRGVGPLIVGGVEKVDPQLIIRDLERQIRALDIARIKRGFNCPHCAGYRIRGRTKVAAVASLLFGAESKARIPAPTCAPNALNSCDRIRLSGIWSAIRRELVKSGPA